MKRLIIISATIVTLLSVATYAYIHSSPYYSATPSQKQMLDEYFTTMDKRMNQFDQDIQSWIATTSQYEQGKIDQQAYTKAYESMTNSLHADMVLVDAIKKPDPNPNSNYQSFANSLTLNILDYQQFVKADYESHSNSDSLSASYLAVQSINNFQSNRANVQSKYHDLKKKYYK